MTILGIEETPTHVEPMSFHPTMKDGKEFSKGFKPIECHRRWIDLPKAVYGKKTREITPELKTGAKNGGVERAGHEIRFHVDHCEK